MSKGKNKFKNVKKDSKANKSNMGTAKKEEKKVFNTYYYMTPEAIHSRDIVETVEQMDHVKVELWDQIEVIEIELSDKQTIDIMMMDNQFGDETDREFLDHKQIKSVFSIETEQNNVEQLKIIFQLVVEKYKGFVCSDSEDFMPFIVEMNAKLA